LVVPHLKEIAKTLLLISIRIDFIGVKGIGCSIKERWVAARLNK
jgi:hypothetical protein